MIVNIPGRQQRFECNAIQMTQTTAKVTSFLITPVIHSGAYFKVIL